jgi:hypothetical protein
MLHSNRLTLAWVGLLIRIFKAKTIQCMNSNYLHDPQR